MPMDKMYVLGGYADGNVAQRLNEEYDPVRDEWRERAPLPRGGNHIATVGLGGKLYAIGGFSEQNANAFPDVSVYDPATDKWTSTAALPIPLGSMAVVAVDGVIHALGGATGTTAENRHTVNVHYIYDPKTDKWTDSVPLPLLLAAEDKGFAVEDCCLRPTPGSWHQRKVLPLGVVVAQIVRWRLQQY
jgi:N-acetylneuraminic acid mutarotase